ncbi:MAG: MotA/TolQ/ExbB proton channel family protein [Clostridiales bacterium]|nr:MotA/TolQ/ExbB proton channel family protein [Clostridiales bacterium]
MKTTTLPGILIGFVLIVFSILLGGDLRRYFDLPSVLIVIGGVFAAALASYPTAHFRQLLQSLREVFQGSEIDLMSDLDGLLDLANKARREGMLALDGMDFPDPFLKKGIELIVDGTDSELVREILEGEMALREEHDLIPVKVLLSMAGLAPAFGMVGTLIGLINMLMFLSDSAALGPAMATALITTFYGVILANLIFTPMATKLRAANGLRLARCEMLLQGILMIQQGSNPRIIQEKLISYVPEDLRERKDSLGAEESENMAGIDGQTATE